MFRGSWPKKTRALPIDKRNTALVSLRKSRQGEVQIQRTANREDASQMIQDGS